MFVSVIITCYNLEKYIEAAIESVLNQDYNKNLYEIIIINDFSSDTSYELIKKYPNIKSYNNSNNLGVLLSTVLGIEKSKGEIIFFLDGDDIWEINKISEIVNVYKKNPNTVLVTHDLAYIDTNGFLINKKTRPEEEMSLVNISNYDEKIRMGILLHSDYVWLGSAYSIKNNTNTLIEFCNFVKNLSDPYNTYQDWTLAYWIVSHPNSECMYLNKKLLLYRIHGMNHSGDSSTSIKAVRNIQRTLNTMKAINDIGNYFKLNNNLLKYTQIKLNFYLYLNNLYSGNKVITIKYLFSIIPYLKMQPNIMLKEITRFILIIIFGLKIFTIIINKLKFIFTLLNKIERCFK